MAPAGITLGWLAAALVGAAWAIESGYGVPLSADNIRFERPNAWVLMLGGLLVLLARGHLRTRRAPRLRVSNAAVLSRMPKGPRSWLSPTLVGARSAAMLLLGIALMGPQSIHARNATEVQGIDIVLALDMSLSMQAADIKPNRFVATQQVVDDFIARRPNDRLGGVVFGRDAFTLLPLTTDHESLRTLIRELQLEMIDGKGTAIGNAIGTALNRLRKSDAKSRVVILLTDGESNSGNISPSQAADFAQTLDVKVYTILMGRSDKAPVATGRDIFGNPTLGSGTFPINPELLKEVADKTGAEAFQVADREGLERSFHVILDQLERSDIEDAGRVYGELFPALVVPALLLLLLEAFAGSLILRSWP